MKTMKFVMALAILGIFGRSLVHADGAGIYTVKCASCHGKDGKGNPAMAKMFKVEPSALDLAASKSSEGDLIKITADGKNKMPAYSKQLKADEIKSVVQYICSLAPKKVEVKKEEAVAEKKEEPVTEAVTPPAEVKSEPAKAAVASAVVVSEDAKKEYAKSCGSCHGKDGKGNPAMAKMFKVDPSALSMVDAGTLGKSDEELVKITANGLNKMPAYKGKISDKIIAEIVAYMRSLK